MSYWCKACHVKHYAAKMLTVTAVAGNVKQIFAAVVLKGQLPEEEEEGGVGGTDGGKMLQNQVCRWNKKRDYY